MTPLTKFKMEFEPQTIEHLGLNLYSSLPPVIGELVSNSWDADAKSVKIKIPSGAIFDSSIVVVQDDGIGMTDAEVQEQFLLVGRNRREDQTRDTSPGGRPVTGRKGLGKLSAFGVANELEIRTVRKGLATCIRLNYEKMKAWPKGKTYEPEFVASRSGPTTDKAGTEIKIQKFRRRKPIDAGWIRTELARRFTVIGTGFRVFINGVEIKPADRRLRHTCKAAWDVSSLKSTDVVDAKEGWTVTGWIGVVARSSQTDRGVDIFARGKAVELDTMFNMKSTHAQLARAYVVGEVHADFLDTDADRIATARNSVNWETDAGQRLQEWGQIALKDVFSRWLDQQRKEKERRIVTTENFEEWLQSRTPHERKVAKKMLKLIVEDESIEPEAAAPLLQLIKSNVEFQAFQELVDDIEETKGSLQSLLKLVKEWRIIEAREKLKLSDGRLEVMEKLSEFIEKGALEVQQMQPLFEKNLWLVDPTWGTASGQTTYTQQLRDKFPESGKTPAEERRIDLWGVKVSAGVEILEIKRPEKTLGLEDLTQIARYVDWARSNLMGSGPNAPRYIHGRLIVGKLSNKGEIHQNMARLAGADIRVETYRDLLQRARTVYGEVQRELEEVAPEYSVKSRRRAKSAKKATARAKKKK